MRSIRRKLAVLVVPIGLAVAGLAVSSHDNPAAAASARTATTAERIDEGDM